MKSALVLNSPYLWFLTLGYTMAMLLANWFDPRLIQLFGYNTDAGILIFPFTFLLSNLITEVYGYKHARRAMWCGFLFNIIFILFGQLVIHLPSPSFADNTAFDSLFAFNIRIIVASIISYFCSEPLNSYILAKLKIKTQGRLLALRFLSSTIIAAGVDSFIFMSIAFQGKMSNANLLSIILTMWFIKVSIELLGLPVSIPLATKLKRAENLDIFDRNTNFNLFKLDATYHASDNHCQFITETTSGEVHPAATAAG